MSNPAPQPAARRHTELLDDRCRAMVRLAAEGLTVEEIGRMMGLHPIAVRCVARAIHAALADPQVSEGDEQCGSAVDS